MQLSYDPLETPLLRQVRDLDAQGWIAVDGLQMLPEQGKMQFELFTSRKAPAKLMEEEVLRAYKNRVSAESAIFRVSETQSISKAQLAP